LAFAMTTQGQSSVLNYPIPQVNGLVPPIQIADKTFTTAKTSTAVQNLGFGCTKFQVVIYLKTLVLGANTSANQGPLFYLEAADVVGMNTNLTVIGEMTQAVNVASATEVQCMRIWGQTPVAAKQFLQITVDPTLMGAGSSGTFDVLIMATP